MWIKSLARLCFGAVLLASAVHAQTAGTGTLVGTITDNSGAIMSGVKVSVVNTETSFTSETVTSAEGAYQVPYLSPGIYRVTIEAPGFKRYLREGLQIRTGEIPRIDVQLEVGAVSESIRVEGSAPLIDTETAQAGLVLSGDQLLKIPVSQKRAIRMTFYYPGAQPMSGFHILGQRARAMGYTVDGINGKEPGVGNIGGTNEQISTTQDAFEEVKLHTTGTPAEYGHAAGGLMSIIFKSGTNQFHGSVEDRFIARQMIHRSYLEQLPRTNPFTYHETTLLFSGPLNIPKLYKGTNKTFWLAGWEQHFENAGTAGAITTVPTTAMYNGDFSFAGQNNPTPLPIYDPATTELVNGTWTRQPFPNNQIPRSRFDPAVQKFLAMTPFASPNQAGIPGAQFPTQNLVENQIKQIRRIRWDGKIDHQFTSNHRMYGRYSQARHRAWKGDYQAQFAWRDLDTNATNAPVDHYNGVISDILILSPTLSNEFRGGYNRRERYETPATANGDWGTKLGIPRIDGSTFPNFNLGGAVAGLDGSQTAALRSFQNIGEDFTFQDNITKVAGKHTFKGGYELIRTRYNGTTGPLPGGTYTFGGTDLPFTPNTGNTFAAFLLGSVTEATYTQDYAAWLPRWWGHQFYFQDDWKPVRGLTLNLGVRWSYESPYQTKYGQQSQFDPTARDPLTGRMGAIVHPSGSLANKDLNNFAPRLGLAWSFKPNWVFRASFGMIHQDIQATQTYIQNDEYLATATLQSPVGDPRPIFKLSDGPPPIQFNVNPDGSVPFVGTNYSSRNASWFDPKLRMPYVMSWSGGIQWGFRNNWVLETLYQAQSGVGLINTWDTNRIPLNISNDPAVLNTIFTASQNYKPYPQFGAVNLISNFGHNTYHGGTVRVEKRYSAGLVLNAFYTFQKTITDNENETGVGGVDYYNRRLEKGLASYSIAHRFVNVLSYELPFGTGRAFMNGGGFTNQLLGGWELTWTQTLQAGLPYTVTQTGSPNRYLPMGTQRPNIITSHKDAVNQDWKIGENRFPTSAQNPYTNFSSFAYPAAFTTGNLGRNTFIGPGLNWTQLSLTKYWNIGERARFQIRLDANNFPFKMPQFDNPQSQYNGNSPASFGRITATRGSFSDVGTANGHMLIVGKFQF
ncbi:MAG TPA: carboxypeptidase regulatory-like domain-containing protein [Bryobacteraceae bacterium]|nr:carboxypeptidase regulatory-like domain-containing protein [Bryobacteraceae bacterium]